MIQTVAFEKHLIAPCGMNCGTCIAYLRDKNKCPGCRITSSGKAISVKKNALSQNAAICKRQHQNSVMIVKNIRVKG